MSAPDLPQTVDEAAEPTELVVRRLVRAIDFAEGFWLGFAKSNLREQRTAVTAACKGLLKALNIRLIEVELNEPVEDLLPILRERLIGKGQPNDHQKLAIFVYGLEHSIPSSDAYPSILSSLNLNRELFRQEVSLPLLLWLPDYALTALARGAPDFWAWRSGLYEFAPEANLAERTFEPIRGEALHVTSSLSERAKRERLMMLKGLLADYRELGNGPREREAQSDILLNIGLVYQDLGEWAEAKSAYDESLSMACELGDKFGIAIVKHNLGTLAYQMEKYGEAKRLCEESLNIKRDLGDKDGIATSLHLLGALAQQAGDYEEAKRLYEESLILEREVNSKDIMAASLHQLGSLAQRAGDYVKARQLYAESLDISSELGYKEGEAVSHAQLGLLDEAEGKYKEAMQHTRLAEEIVLLLGNRYYIDRIAKQRQRLERMAPGEG